MRVVYPHTKRMPEVEAAAPGHAEWFDVSADADAYWRLMCELWADGESVIVVEHDVVMSEAILRALTECPEPWCVHPYDSMCHKQCQEVWANMLGCTRFRAELMAELPQALSSIPPEQRDWHYLCDAIAGDKVGGNPAPLREGSLRSAGHTHHWHEPPVRHLSVGFARFAPRQRPEDLERAVPQPLETR